MGKSVNILVYLTLPVYHNSILDQQERLEGKKSDDAEKDSVPQMSHKDLQIADKVSQYNVSVATVQNTVVQI